MCEFYTTNTVCSWETGGPDNSKHVILAWLHVSALYQWESNHNSHAWYLFNTKLYSILDIKNCVGTCPKMICIRVCKPISQTVHQKIKKCWKCTHPLGIKDVEEFVSSSERIWRNVHNLLNTLQWKGTVRMRFQMKGFKIKIILMIELLQKCWFLLHKTNGWSGVMWILMYGDVFISCLN